MTNRDTKLRAVAAHFLGWEPGKTCTEAQFVVGDFYCVRHNDLPGHRLPPPDPADPAVRVALEDALLGQGASIKFLPTSDKDIAQGTAGRGQVFCCIRARAEIFWRWSGAHNTPADALLDAAYQLVRRKEE